MERSISGSGEGKGARPTAHELARYEALFAARTRPMKSSAMREMMALTQRPDVISLAGGLPGPTTVEAQIEMDADGMPIEELEIVLDRLQARGRRPKFIYTIPNFQNPGGVTMSLPRRRRLVQVARERELLVLEDNPYGLLRYEGEPLPTLYSLDAEAEGTAGAADLVIYLGTFSKILSPGLRLGWAVAPRPVLEKLNLGKQGSDLCSSPVTQLFVSAYFKQRGADGSAVWSDYLDELRVLYRRRRDLMLEALEEHFGERARWTRPEGGLFIWATLEDHIDTTDLLALARSEGVAFVPGRAAYMDGHSGASSMRLNFAGVPDADIREGIRRIGRVLAQQVRLLGTLSGSLKSPAAVPLPDGEPATERGRAPAAKRDGGPAAKPDREPAAEELRAPEEGGPDTAGEGSAAEDAPLADVVALPRRQDQGSVRRRRDR